MIMYVYDDTSERYSLCIPYKKYNGDLVYYRIADFDPEDPLELAPVLVKSDAHSKREELANPDTLYNPGAINHHDDRDTDFLFFKWHQTPENPAKQFTTSVFDDCGRDLRELPEPMEVIICRGAANEKDLQDALEKGIEFNGRTTRQFYIVYSEKQDPYHSILCNRSDFLFRNGTITLPQDIANPRATILSAPKVQIRSSDILKSSFKQTDYRMVYANLDTPKETGRVLLRPLSYYAADYIKWFIHEQSCAVNKSTRRSIMPIIESALSRPESIRAYLDVDEYDSEIEALRKAITDCANGEDDKLLSSITNALLKCEPVHEQCIREVSEKSEGYLSELRRQEESAKKSLESRETEADRKILEIRNLEERKKSIDIDIASANEALAKLKEDRESVLANLESNIVLKLGLRAVASGTVSAGAAQEKIHAASGVFVSVQKSTELPVPVLSRNLQQLGLSSLASDTLDECRRLAVSVLAALSVTSFLVAPAGIAYAIADALSIASSGVTSRRVHVPSEYPDVNSVAKACEGSEHVTIVENLIDSVNEGILLPLLSRDIGNAVILPYTSMDSMDLVAKEAWGSMFMLRSYPLVKIGQRANHLKTMTLSMRINDMLPSCSPSDDVLDESKDIPRRFSLSGIPRSSLPLISSFVLAVENMVEDDAVEPYAIQHLAVASKTARENAEAAESIRNLVDDDGTRMFLDDYARQE